MNPKNSKKSLIHENADANITCDFGDGDISRSRSFLSNTYRRERTTTQKTDSHVDFLNLIVDVIAVFQAVLFHVPRLLEPPVGIEIRYILLVFYICDCSVPGSAVSCNPLARTPCGYRDTLRIVSILHI